MLEALGQLTAKLKQGADRETIYLTLLAIHILTGAYKDKEAEWQQIVNKAKTYLESVGVRKPNALLKKFTLELIDH